MARIDDLREIVRKRRAAVTAKENRIRRNTGVEIQGTREDPRRPPGVIKKYNQSQLTTYLNVLNAFMSRDNGYVPDSSGGFIAKKDWLKYKRIERKYNRIAIAHFDAIGDIVDPYRGVTIREAEQLYIPESKRAQGDILHRPYSPVERNAKNIKSNEALAKLTAQLEGKVGKDYLPKAIKASRKQATQMLNNAGLTDLKDTIEGLSDHQFNILWNYWGFASRLGQIGSSGSHRSKNVREMDSKDRMSSQEKENIQEDVKEILDQAKEIPEPKRK